MFQTIKLRPEYPCSLMSIPRDYRKIGIGMDCYSKNNSLITKLINYLLLEVPMKYIPISPDNFRKFGQQEAQKKRFKNLIFGIREQNPHYTIKCNTSVINNIITIITNSH